MFEKSLLNGSSERRIDYFKNYVIAHPNLKNALEKIESYLALSDVNTIILVCGPTGVGKTTLYNKLVETLYKKNISNMEIDRGLIPVLPVEAIAPEGSNFNWKEFYIRSLLALNEPLVNHKISVLEKGNTISFKSNQSVSALRRALENAIEYRKPSVFMIDEGQHFMKVKSAKSNIDQMDRLKSLASTTNTPIILFGTYELLTLRNLSGQLVRRVIEIDFPRYKTTDEDIKTFRSVLWSLQRQLPLEEEPELIQDYEYFYERTIGCIGILKQWILKTFQYHLTANPHLKTLTVKEFKEFEYSYEKCVRLAKDAIQGEENLNDSEKLSELKKLLYSSSNEVNNKEINKQKNEPKRTRKGVVGQRKPKRDAVGGVN